MGKVFFLLHEKQNMQNIYFVGRNITLNGDELSLFIEVCLDGWLSNLS